MDAGQYKDYVLFMLFIKYISDKYGDSDDFAPPVLIPPGVGFKDMVALKGKFDIGDRINTQIIQPLIDANSRLITLEGQELDVTTAGLARMNMILHDFPTASAMTGSTLADPKFIDADKSGKAQLRTYDYVVANPPFSVKTWRTGLTPASDPYQRFAWGEPPAMQGDYAFSLPIVRSMKGSGKGACILPHGVLFRGNAEAVIRRQLVRSGTLKANIGLPANLFYGTGIPACILVLDKEHAATRASGSRGVFMIDASKGFIKDGNKNRLREQDLHRIVDTFTRSLDVPRYARQVPLTEIADAKNDFNLNLPRYIDSSAPEDLQDIVGHLRGGIPERDLDDPASPLAAYWQVQPGVRAGFFAPTSTNPGHAGYARLTLPLRGLKPAILGHAEFSAFNQAATRRFTDWRAASVQGELYRVSQTLTGGIRELAKRYATPLPQLTDEVAALAAQMEQHLAKMGASWK